MLSGAVESASSTRIRRGAMTFNETLWTNSAQREPDNTWATIASAGVTALHRPAEISLFAKTYELGVVRQVRSKSSALGRAQGASGGGCQRRRVSRGGGKQRKLCCTLRDVHTGARSTSMIPLGVNLQFKLPRDDSDEACDTHNFSLSKSMARGSELNAVGHRGRKGLHMGSWEAWPTWAERYRC
eukprot:2020376-Rhodomonas_salina.1